MSPRKEQNSEKLIHKALESGQGSIEPKWYDSKLEEPGRGDESRQRLYSRSKKYLLITPSHIQGGNVSDLPNVVKKLVHPGHGVGVNSGDTVEPLEVNTHLNGPIFFGNQHHR